MVKEKNRNSNFELMRIISMLAIILWHIIVHGKMIENCTNDAIKIILEFLKYILIFHVNSFVLLSGYFQSKSKFKLSKFLALLFQVIFYLVLILIISIKLGIVKDYGITTFVNSLLPSSINNYWFIKMYIVVYLLSDIINKFVNSLKKDEYKNILIILFVIFSLSSFFTGGKFFENNGHNFYNFILLYMIGGYFSRYKIRESYYFKRFSDNGYRFVLFFIFALMIFLNYSINRFAYDISGYNGLMSELSNRILSTNFLYSTPFVMIQTMCYFLLFETLQIKSNFVNLISSCMFGVYLIHDSNFIRTDLYKFLKIDCGKFDDYDIFIKMLIALVLIFICGVIIELIRKLIIKLLSKLKLTHKLINKIKLFVNSFNFKINW